MSNSRQKVKEQIEVVLDEVGLERMTPGQALRYVMACLDKYAQQQKLLGMSEIVELYNKGVKL